MSTVIIKVEGESRNFCEKNHEDLRFEFWFALLPYVSLLGLGAFTAGLFRGKPEAEVSDDDPGSDAA
jgi:hypothetical protein